MLAAREGSQHLTPHCLGHLPSRRKVMLVTKPMSSALRPGGGVQTASFFELLEKGGDCKNEEFLRNGGIDSHHHQRGVMVVVGNKGGGSAGTRWK